MYAQIQWLNGYIYLTMGSDKAPLVLLDTFNAYVINEIRPTQENASAGQCV